MGHGDYGRLYADALREAGALCAIAVGSEASAASLSSRVREPVYVTLERALASERPDAIAVLSPTRLHFEHTRAGIAAGLPVLVIKPATCAPGACEALDGLAARAATPVMVGHEGVFSPAFLAVESLVLDGTLGTLREVGWLRAGPDRLSGGRERRAGEGPAGADLGYLYASVMHDVYVTSRLAGRAAPASATVLHAVASREAPELLVELTYPAGWKARIKHDAREGTSFRRGLHVVGDRASALWLVEPGRTRVTLRRGRQERDVPFAGARGENPGSAVVEEFLAVVAGRAVRETLLDGARALRAARDVTEAAARRLGVPLDLDAVAGGPDAGWPPA